MNLDEMIEWAASLSEPRPHPADAPNEIPGVRHETNRSGNAWFDIWIQAHAPTRRASRLINKNPADADAAYAALHESGLWEVLQRLHDERWVHHEDPDCEDVRQMFSKIDAFYACMLGGEGSQRPLAGADIDMDPTLFVGTRLRSLEEALTRADNLVPATISEWRRSEFIGQVCIVLGVLNYTPKSLKRDEITGHRFTDLLARSDLGSAITRALELASSPDAEPVGAQELSRFYELRMALMKQVGETEQGHLRRNREQGGWR